MTLCYRVIATLLFEFIFLPVLAFGISWFTCFLSLLLEEWDASVFIQQKINLSYYFVSQFLFN